MAVSASCRRRMPSMITCEIVAIVFAASIRQADMLIMPGKCKIGWGVKEMATATHQIVCEPCAADTFSNVLSAVQRCKPCIHIDSLNCSSSQFPRPCKPWRQAYCSDLEDGKYFDRDFMAEKSCSRNCRNSSLEIVTYCTETSDIVCGLKTPDYGQVTVAPITAAVVPEPGTNSSSTPPPGSTGEPIFTSHDNGGKGNSNVGAIVGAALAAGAVVVLVVFIVVIIKKRERNNTDGDIPGQDGAAQDTPKQDEVTTVGERPSDSPNDQL